MRSRPSPGSRPRTAAPAAKTQSQRRPGREHVTPRRRGAQMKAVVVGGVAGGMSFAARARRLAEDAEIVVLERDRYVSYANCGLPYHLGGEIGDRDALLLHTPQSLAESLALDVRTGPEVLAIDPARRTVAVRELAAPAGPAAERELRAGWRRDGFTGNQDECLAYIDETWTDMRPASLRSWMRDHEQAGAD